MHYPIIKLAINPVIFDKLKTKWKNPLRGENEYKLDLILRAVKTELKFDIQILSETYGETLCIITDKGSFTPDVIITSQKETWFFELDEPYSKKDKNPIHFKGSDEARDFIINNSGIHIVRIAESQIFKSPTKLKEGIIKLLSNSYQKDIFDNSILTPKWTRQQAQQLADQNSRDNYDTKFWELFDYKSSHQTKLLMKYNQINFNSDDKVALFSALNSFYEEVDMLTIYPRYHILELKSKITELENIIVKNLEKLLACYSYLYLSQILDTNKYKHLNPTRSLIKVNSDLFHKYEHELIAQQTKSLSKLIMQNKKKALKNKLLELYYYPSSNSINESVNKAVDHIFECRNSSGPLFLAELGEDKAFEYFLDKFVQLVISVFYNDVHDFWIKHKKYWMIPKRE